MNLERLIILLFLDSRGGEALNGEIIEGVANIIENIFEVEYSAQYNNSLIKKMKRENLISSELLKTSPPAAMRKLAQKGADILAKFRSFECSLGLRASESRQKGKVKVSSGQQSKSFDLDDLDLIIDEISEIAPGGLDLDRAARRILGFIQDNRGKHDLASLLTLKLCNVLFSGREMMSAEQLEIAERISKDLENLFKN